MKRMQISKAFTLMESGPVVFITTNDGEKNNIMTISWTMVLDFTPMFAITTGPWNYSYAALRKFRECVIAIPTVDLIQISKPRPMAVRLEKALPIRRYKIKASS